MQKTESSEIVEPVEPVESSEGGVTQTLSSLVSHVEHQIKANRELHRELKKLEREIIKDRKRLTKPVKPKRTVVQKPIKVNSKMQKFLEGQNAVSPNNDGCFTRQVMMKMVSLYIKDKNLQNQENKKQWTPDSVLCKLFDLDKKQLYTFMNINGIISRVIEKPKE